MTTAAHLTPEHFYAFGYIVSTYAKVETGFSFIIAKIIGVPRHVAVLLCEPYSSQSLRNVVSTVHTTDYDMSDDLRERITDLANQFEGFGQLRNAIAHDIWTKGFREGSIKPMRLNIRSGKPKFIGADDGERDWTLDELSDEAEKLQALHRAQQELIKDLGPEHEFDQE